MWETQAKRITTVANSGVLNWLSLKTKNPFLNLSWVVLQTGPKFFDMRLFENVERGDNERLLVGSSVRLPPPPPPNYVLGRYA